MKKIYSLLVTVIATAPIDCMDKEIKKLVTAQQQIEQQNAVKQQFFQNLQANGSWSWQEIMQKYDKKDIIKELVACQKQSLTDKNGETFFWADMSNFTFGSITLDIFKEYHKNGFDLGAQRPSKPTMLIELIKHYNTKPRDYVCDFITLLHGNIHQQDSVGKTALIYTIENNQQEFFTKLMRAINPAGILSHLEPDALLCALEKKRVPMVEALIMRDVAIPQTFPTSITNSTDNEIQAILKCLVAVRKYKDTYRDSGDTATACAYDPELQPFLETIFTYAATNNHTHMIEAMTVDGKYQKVVDACLKYNCAGALYHALDNLGDAVDDDEKASSCWPCFYASKYIEAGTCGAIDSHSTVGHVLGYICGTFWATITFPCALPIVLINYRPKLERFEFSRGCIQWNARVEGAYVFLKAFERYFKQKQQNATASEQYRQLEEQEEDAA